MFNPFKQETYEQRVIRFADIMVQQTDYTGKIDKSCLSPFATFDKDVLPPALLKIRQELIKLQPIIDGDLEPYKNWLNKNYDDIKKHLLSHEYIDNPKPDTQEWILNETGKKMKRYKGHKKYQSYLDKKQKAEMAEINGKIHWLRRVIITAIVSGLIGYGLRYLTEPKEKKSTDQPASVEQSPSLPAKQPVKSVP
jgi:hypothetical protein